MHIYIFKSGLQNDFELLRILNYWSLNYRGSTVITSSNDVYKIATCMINNNLDPAQKLFLVASDLGIHCA